MLPGAAQPKYERSSSSVFGHINSGDHTSFTDRLPADACSAATGHTVPSIGFGALA